MNFRLIRYIIGLVLIIEGAFLSLPCIVAVVYRESSGFGFLVVMLASVAVGFLLKWKKPSNTTFYAKEGFVIVALSWIAMSIVGAVPFVLNGDIPNYLDALFEMVSGFTTTGASILNNVEALSRCGLFWRSFAHWLGGMGVLVFVLTILPMNGSSVYLMKAESPGPSVNKLVPRVKNTAMILYGIYICMTIIEFIFLVSGQMPVFDALTITFGTAGTGGFGVLNDSMASYSQYIKTVVTVFMILFGINFNFYYLLLCKRWKDAFSSNEMWAYLGIIAASIAVISWDISRVIFVSVPEAVREASFQVASIITTTGYSTTDFNTWPQLSKTILIALMFIGACAGSTGGGIKVSRILILFKSMQKELSTMLHPHDVTKIKIDGRVVEHSVVRSVNVFVVAYILIFAMSLLLISFDEKDFVTNFTSVAATINNIGPGLEIVGPMGNFSSFSPFSKLVLIFDVLAGRLELFPLLLLFNFKTWSKN